VGTKKFSAERELFRVNLQRFMDDLEMSQADLAAASGESVFNISRYLRGETAPNGVRQQKLAEALGRSADDFYQADPPPLDPLRVPTFMLRTPGKVDEDVSAIYDELREAVAAANRKAAEIRKRKSKR
jgi:transcriptional regulator with XRE-family HTH domain